MRFRISRLKLSLKGSTLSTFHFRFCKNGANIIDTLACLVFLKVYFLIQVLVKKLQY